MSITRLIGRKLPVDYQLLKDLDIKLIMNNDQQALAVKGTIMESAKVFEKLKVKRNGNTIYIQILASLPFWKRNRTPDFDETNIMDLPPGIYNIEYLNDKKPATFITSIRREG